MPFRANGCRALTTRFSPGRISSRWARWFRPSSPVNDERKSLRFFFIEFQLVFRSSKFILSPKRNGRATRKRLFVTSEIRTSRSFVTGRKTSRRSFAKLLKAKNRSFARPTTTAIAPSFVVPRTANPTKRLSAGPTVRCPNNRSFVARTALPNAKNRLFIVPTERIIKETVMFLNEMSQFPCDLYRCFLSSNSFHIY